MSNSIPLQTVGTELLCETCGYELTGLAPKGLCPECGTPIAQSLPTLRGPTRWEERASLASFIITSAAILFRTSAVYRHFRTRWNRDRSAVFMHLHLAIASVLIGWGVYLHVASYYFVYTARGSMLRHLFYRPVPATLFLGTVILLSFEITIWIAAWLTSWEARYRGYRLPLAVVRRGMDYHAAHYLPVAIVFWATMLGYHLLMRAHWFSRDSDLTYLCVLCGEVVGAAVYLFWTYWIGMRSMMYANA